MNTVTLSVASREDVTGRALGAFVGQRRGAHISFASAELLWTTLTRKRWALLQAMTGQGNMSIREAARRVDRDVKAVHGDVQALINAGVIDRTEAGVIFPYDAVHVDFMLTRAALTEKHGRAPVKVEPMAGRGSERGLLGTLPSD